MKPMLKPPGTKHLKLKCDILLSSLAFNFNLRRYIKDVCDITLDMQATAFVGASVGRCRLTLSNPR